MTSHNESYAKLKEVFEYMDTYIGLWEKETIDEQGHNDYSRFPEIDQGSISAMRLMQSTLLKKFGDNL